MNGSLPALLAAAACTLLLAPRVQAQRYAGLGADTEGFALPGAGVPLEFPADHGPHRAFRIEWWYVTANLRGPDDTPYGIQWTLIRSAPSRRG